MMTNKAWWGEFTLSEQQLICWSIGERKIIIKRLASEWNTWNIESEQESFDTLVCEKDKALEPSGFQHMGRHLQTLTSSKIKVLPALADRAIVTRPVVPLTLLGGQNVRIYVSTPLWFRATTVPTSDTLLDIPFWRPSDSWFGPSTMEGELCYAKYTDARLQLERLEQRQQRAITPVFIHNKRKEAITIERLSVPVPLLSLYQDNQHNLWTNTLNVTRKEDNNMVELVLEKQPPKEINHASAVSPARITSEKHTFMRTISNLFA